MALYIIRSNGIVMKGQLQLSLLHLDGIVSSWLFCVVFFLRALAFACFRIFFFLLFAWWLEVTVHVCFSSPFSVWLVWCAAVLNISFLVPLYWCTLSAVFCCSLNFSLSHNIRTHRGRGRSIRLEREKAGFSVLWFTVQRGRVAATHPTVSASTWFGIEFSW